MFHEPPRGFFYPETAETGRRRVQSEPRLRRHRRRTSFLLFHLKPHQPRAASCCPRSSLSRGANQPGFGETPARGCLSGSKSLRSRPLYAALAQEVFGIGRRATSGRVGQVEKQRRDLRSSEFAAVQRIDDDAEPGLAPQKRFILVPVGARKPPFNFSSRPRKLTALARRAAPPTLA